MGGFNTENLIIKAIHQRLLNTEDELMSQIDTLNVLDKPDYNVYFDSETKRFTQKAENTLTSLEISTYIRNFEEIKEPREIEETLEKHRDIRQLIEMFAGPNYTIYSATIEVMTSDYYYKFNKAEIELIKVSEILELVSPYFPIHKHDFDCFIYAKKYTLKFKYLKNYRLIPYMIKRKHEQFQYDMFYPAIMVIPKEQLDYVGNKIHEQINTVLNTNTSTSSENNANRVQTLISTLTQ